MQHQNTYLAHAGLCSSKSFMKMSFMKMNACYYLLFKDGAIERIKLYTFEHWQHWEGELRFVKALSFVYSVL